MPCTASLRGALGALGLLVAAGCATPPPASDPPPAPPPAPLQRVEVVPAAGIASGEAVAELVGQSARDWLAQRGRLAAEGNGVLRVEIEALRLRAGWLVWCCAWALAPDRLAARVRVETPGVAPGPAYRVVVESALAGYGWRDRQERQSRLARRLGRRIAEGL